MIDTLPLGEIGGQHAPLDAAFGHIADGIEHSPHTQGAGAATTFGGWDHLFAPLPLLVGQVAWVSFFIHSPILHNSRRLFRQALRSFVVGRVSHYHPMAYGRYSHWQDRTGAIGGETRIM